MRRKVVAGVVVLVLIALGGAAFAYTQLTDKPKDALDTALTGVSVDTAADTATIETEPPTTTTDEGEPAEPPERCWPSFGGDPQRRLSRPLINLGVPTRVVWSRKMGDLMEYPPTFCDGVLYSALEHGDILAVDAATGRLLWRRQTQGPHASSPAIWESLVILSSHDGTVTALRRDNGRKVWLVRVPGKVESSSVVVDGVAYFGSTEGRLYAVNAQTGAIRWAYNTGGRINASPSISGERDCISTYAQLSLLLEPPERPQALEHVRQAEHVLLRELLRQRVDRRGASVHDLSPARSWRCRQAADGWCGRTRWRTGGTRRPRWPTAACTSAASMGVYGRSRRRPAA